MNDTLRYVALTALAKVAQVTAPVTTTKTNPFTYQNAANLARKKGWKFNNGTWTTTTGQTYSDKDFRARIQDRADKYNVKSYNSNAKERVAATRPTVNPQSAAIAKKLQQQQAAAAQAGWKRNPDGSYVTNSGDAISEVDFNQAASASAIQPMFGINGDRSAFIKTPRKVNAKINGQQVYSYNGESGPEYHTGVVGASSDPNATYNGYGHAQRSVSRDNTGTPIFRGGKIFISRNGKLAPYKGTTISVGGTTFDRHGNLLVNPNNRRVTRLG